MLGKVSSRFHHLKLYADDETIPQTTKKPVVVESYDEIVLSDPMEASFGRLRNHPAVRVTGNPPSQLALPGSTLFVFDYLSMCLLFNQHAILTNC